MAPHFTGTIPPLCNPAMTPNWYAMHFSDGGGAIGEVLHPELAENHVKATVRERQSSCIAFLPID
jgi:hypothetical protein